MRPIVLAIIAIQLGLALPAVADDADDGDRSISDVLPLFNKNAAGGFWRRARGRR